MGIFETIESTQHEQIMVCNNNDAGLKAIIAIHNTTLGPALGAVHQGVKLLMSGLNTERLVLSGGPLGLMQACLDLVIPYLQERRQFNHTISSFGIMQAKVADMYTALQSSRAYIYRIAQDYDAGTNEIRKMLIGRELVGTL